MRTFAVRFLIMTLVASSIVLLAAEGPAPGDPVAAAAKVFKEGKFAEAEKAYLYALSRRPQNPEVLTRLGSIALLSNRLAEAEKWLRQALTAKPGDPAASALLAESYFRRDEFAQAAPLFRAAGNEAEAEQLESFKDARPYTLEAAGETTSLRFVMTDPLPVVEVRVNGLDPVNFFIDTGAAEVVLDSVFAREAGAVEFGSQTGTYAGGKKAPFAYGRADTLSLGDLVVKNVPVHIMDVRRFSVPVFRGLRVDGIIGTVLLYHFLSTLDYPGGALVLRRPTDENQRRFREGAEGHDAFSQPFWMAGDHYMVAWGVVNTSSPMLFFIDTGLAGGGFTCPESTLRAAGIDLDETRAGEGIGGGGTVRVVPFKVDQLYFGRARQKDVAGLFSGAFPLEDALGFHIGGLISHGFFRSYALTFDFGEMKLYLEEKR
jgi:predicted aspartyl protease